MTWSAPNRVIAILLAILGAAYPVLVYFGLSIFSPRLILVLLIVAVLVRAGLFLGNGKRAQAASFLFIAIILASAGIASELVAIRFYPVIVSATLATLFGLSLVSGMPMIERFARLRSGELDAYAIGYTRKLTGIWVGFFIANGCIAAWTALFASIETWTLYNGLLSYVLIGVLFVGEWPVRRILRARHDRKSSEAPRQENA
ncbi:MULTISPECIES: hypothetical protein [Thalassospira]|uniref:Intracellular septation protein A n=1 Tax=Thalassospira aquimaris TaxID=3037796 RepID=A0ABT6GG36_9PROT|nr:MULTISPECIES: hypothetical protein [Thalassospira]MDG4720873.1 hypothetical protein [Thalassospira sp. FZY0004]